MHVQEATLYGATTRGSTATRISWGAVLAGVVVALSLQFLLALLGAAAGLSLSGNASGKAITNGVLIYFALTSFASLFVGGVVVSLLTGGENRQEAVLSGLVMWGVALVALLFLGAAGVSGGSNALTAAATAKSQVAPMSWEESARQAGVPDAQINELKAKNTGIAAKAQDPATQQAAADAATKGLWYAFFITWISMVFAAAGGYVGAGETFRIVSFGPVGRAEDRREDRVTGLPVPV